MAAVAVNVTGVPEQTGFDDAATETLTGRFVVTLIVIVLDVAGLPEGHVAFEVTTHVTASLLTGAYVKLELFVPAFVLLTFH